MLKMMREGSPERAVGATLHTVYPYHIDYVSIWSGISAQCSRSLDLEKTKRPGPKSPNLEGLPGMPFVIFNGSYRLKFPETDTNEPHSMRGFLRGFRSSL